jgi:hypothetical protein
MSSFENAVIFVHDVERALSELDGFAKQVIATVIFQDYDQDEAAEVLRCARRTICRVFPLAVDQMTETFLEGGLLNRLPKAPGKTFVKGVRAPVLRQVLANKPNKYLQSLSLFPFRNAILKLRVRNQRARLAARFFYADIHANEKTDGSSNFRFGCTPKEDY